MSGVRTIAVNIVSVEEEVFHGDANVVSAPAHDGEVGIYPGHAPLLALLRPGKVKVQTAGREDLLFFVVGGMLEVLPEVVTILADTVERSEDLDKELAMAAKKRAEALAKDSKYDKEDMRKAMEQLEVALARLRLIEELQKKH